MCAECINFINKCTKFRNEAAITQKTLIQRLNDHSFEIKIEPIQVYSRGETKIASIDISEYLGPQKSLESCGYDVTYNMIDVKHDTADDNTENIEEFVSEIQDIPNKSKPKELTKRVKSKVKKNVLKRAKSKKRNHENDQPLDGDDMDKGENGKETEKQEKKAREKEKIECEYCHKFLTSKLSLRNHYKIHTGFDVVCEVR